MLEVLNNSASGNRYVHTRRFRKGRYRIRHEVRTLFKRINQILITLSMLIGAWAVIPSGSLAKELLLNFSQPLNVSNTDRGSQVANIALDANGGVYTAWQESKIGTTAIDLFFRTVNEGATLNEPVLLAPSILGYSYGQLQLSSSFPGEVCAAFTMFNTMYGGAEIVYTSSNDGGITFSQPVLVSDVDTVNSYSPTIATGWATSIAWNDNNTTAGKTAIKYIQSEDGGTTFTSPKNINDSNGVVLAPDVVLWGEGTVYAVWTQNDALNGAEEGFDIFFTKSTDKGANFSTPVNISNYPQKSWRSRIKVDGAGTIYVVWVEGSFFAERQLMFTRSVDGGSSFDKPRVLAGPLTTLETEPVIAASGNGSLWISWMEGSSTVKYNNLVIRSTDAGATFSTAASLPGPSYGIASIDPNVVHTVWTQTPQDNIVSDIYYGRGDVSYKLSVFVPSPDSVVGSGQVTSDTGDLNCANGNCSSTYLHDTTVMLTAETTTTGSTFTGWTQDCSGYAPCILSMTSDQNVTAGFGLGLDNKGPMANVTSTGYDSIANAYSAAGAGATIKAVTGVHTQGTLALDRGIAVTIMGGYDSLFLTPGSSTVMQGKLTIQSGSLRVNNVKVKLTP